MISKRKRKRTFDTWRTHTNSMLWAFENHVCQLPTREMFLIWNAIRNAYESGRRHEAQDAEELKNG